MFLTTDPSGTVERLDQAYGKKWHEWLPETLKIVIEAQWGEINDMHLERLLALRNLLKDGFFWHDVDVFEATINAFNWVESDHRIASHPSPAQIVYGVKIVRKLTNDHEFGIEVLKYIASIFIDREIIYVPESFGLKGAQEFIDIFFKDQELKKIVEVKWRAEQEGDCGNLEEKAVDVQIAKLLAIKQFVDIGGIAPPEDRGKLLAGLILG